MIAAMGGVLLQHKAHQFLFRFGQRLGALPKPNRVISSIIQVLPEHKHTLALKGDFLCFINVCQFRYFFSTNL